MKSNILRKTILLYSVSALLFSALVSVQAQSVHDVAVVNVTMTLPYGAQAVYPASNWKIHINVAVENQGTEAENFTVTTYYDSNAIETKNVNNLAPGANTTLTFTWNTNGVNPCAYNYTTEQYIPYNISAEASAVPGEVDTDDNTLVDGTVVVRRIGDVNGDNQVDAWDLYLVGRSKGTYFGEDPNYNPNADFNGDGNVGIADLAFLAMNWYKGVPRPQGPPITTPGYATVSIYPSLIQGPKVGDTFTVDIKIENVTGLYTWSIGLGWNPLILDCTAVTADYTFFGPIGDGLIGPWTVNNTLGEIYPPAGATRIIDSGVTGSGTLLHVNFTVLSPSGSTWLDFMQVTLINSAGESIPFDLINSYFSLYPPEPHAPTARFSYSPAVLWVNETVNFDGSKSSRGWNGTAVMPIVSYHWDFGDGTTGTGPHTTHNYTLKGTYTVTLNVTDSQGLWNTTSKVITVSPQQTAIYLYPPHVLGDVNETFKVYINIEGVKDLWIWAIGVSWNSSVLECLSFTFNYSFFEPDWTLEGTINNSTGEINPPYFASLDGYPYIGVSGSGTLAQVEFRVKAPLWTWLNLTLYALTDISYDIPCQVVNGSFGNPPPHGPNAHFTYHPNDAFVNVTTTFDASASSPGWNGTATSPIANYAWDFGDETNIITADSTVTHTYTAVGNYTVTLSVMDKQGNWSTITRTVIVNLMEFSLVTPYEVHLDLNHWFSEGASLTIAFYTYDGVYEGNITVWTGATPTWAVVSIDLVHPQGKHIEVANLMLTDDSGNVLKTVTSFVTRRSQLMEWLLEMDQKWILAPPEQKPNIFMEILQTDMQWPYAPP